MINTTADQSIIDCIIQLRGIVKGVGGTIIIDDDEPETDFDGIKTMNTYLGEVASSMGQTPTGNDTIVDEFTGMAAMIANLGKIVRCVT